ncbi:hypothetical protein HN51_066504, partial [Arachis hypogaea]
AYDRAAIKFHGVEADINFNIEDYEEDLKQMTNLTKEEFVHVLQRQSTGFPRGISKYRGVTLHKCLGRACGEYHTCALTDSGEVYAWGNDVCCSDLVNKGWIKNQWIPHKLSGPLDGISISTIACGEWHTAIVSSCGNYLHMEMVPSEFLAMAIFRAVLD